MEKNRVMNNSTYLQRIIHPLILIRNILQQDENEYPLCVRESLLLTVTCTKWAVWAERAAGWLAGISSDMMNVFFTFSFSSLS